MKRLFLSSVFVSIVIIAFSTVSFGAGFQVPEQGVASMGMGMGFIGKADDLSAVYHNPAGLTQLKGNHVYGGLAGISATASYSRPGFTTQDNKSDIIPVPLIAFSTDFGERMKNVVVALAVNAPFGLRNEYDAGGPQRYLTTEISLKTIYVGPYVGWQVHPKVSLGAGFQYVYASGKIGQKINYGGRLNPALNENASYDGTLELYDANDTGLAANFGILITPTERLQVGATWRSGIDINVKGDVRLTIPDAVTQLTGGLIQSVDVDGKTTVSLPQVFGLGIAYQLSEGFTVIADVNRITWNVYKDLDFDFEPDVAYLPDTPNPRNWENTTAVRFGAELQLSDSLAVRTGYLFDQSPIPDNTLGPELPTGDRHGLTFGFGYQWGNATLDFAYAHLFIKDRDVGISLRDPQPLGNYKSSANIFGFSLNYAFGASGS